MLLRLTDLMLNIKAFPVVCTQKLPTADREDWKQRKHEGEAREIKQESQEKEL